MSPSTIKYIVEATLSIYYQLNYHIHSPSSSSLSSPGRRYLPPVATFTCSLTQSPAAQLLALCKCVIAVTNIFAYPKALLGASLWSSGRPLVGSSRDPRRQQQPKPASNGAGRAAV